MSDTTTMTSAQLEKLLGALSPDEQAELDALLADDIQEAFWRPLPGPQAAAFASRANIIGFGGSAGSGKGLALDTPLPTPTGWTTMGDVQVGDWLLSDTGEPCQVLAVSDTNHRRCFRLTFDDGSTIVADDVHRWVTFDARELGQLTRLDPEWRARRRARRPSTAAGNKSEAFTESLRARNSAREHALLSPPLGTMRDTLEIAQTLFLPSGRGNNHAIRLAGALQLPEAHLPIPPYTLGAWLGDGTSASGGITGKDPEILDRIEADGFSVTRSRTGGMNHYVRGLGPLLRAAGLLRNKHIPQEYLRASEGQRLALLQGLMDTDGHATPHGSCEFDGVNERLVDGVLELVLSLGIKATKTAGRATISGRHIGPKWRVGFTTRKQVFCLQRKQTRLSGQTRRTTGFRYLTACDSIDPVPTRCVAVSSPGRQFLAGRQMIPTHNSDLILGKALMCAHTARIMRREGTQLVGLTERLAQMLGSRDGWNGQSKIWRDAGPRKITIEFGATPNAGDENRYQGRAADYIAFDEAPGFLESQVRFLLGWNRSVIPGVSPSAIMTFNPPSSTQGRWIIRFFAPWIDKDARRKAEPGELVYVATVPQPNGTSADEFFVPPEPFVLRGRERIYKFDPADFRPEDAITPSTRTFIPGRISDNPYLIGTGYLRQLQSLKEPLRSQLLYGDFSDCTKEDAFQVIPGAWVDAAMERWRDRAQKGEMISVGVDVARGGEDFTVIAKLHEGNWFDRLVKLPGADTPDGPTTAGMVMANLRNDAPVHIDAIGIGASAFDFLRGMYGPSHGVNVSHKATARDRSGMMTFKNLRSQLWWQCREALDPANGEGVALPPDEDLKAQLCAATYDAEGNTVQVSSTDDIKDIIGRSPDDAVAVILALIRTPKRSSFDNAEATTATQGATPYDPYAGVHT